MKALPDQALRELYEIDNALWIEATIALLKQQEFEGLDLDHLIEELEDLGKRDLNKVKSLLRQIMVHLLLLDYWQREYEQNHRHWRCELIAFRDDMNNTLTNSLKIKLVADLERIYQVALKQVVEKTELLQSTFPSLCPYSFDQLSADWYPN
jgi:AcrR family transcriptional regulator